MSTDAGFTALLAVAQSLVGIGSALRLHELSHDEVEAYLTKNADALNRAREVLRGGCAVVVEYTREFYEWYWPACCDLCKLGECFCLSARHAARRGDVEQAVRDGLAALDLAVALRRGGLNTGRLVGLTIEGMAIGRLRRIHRRLHAAAARHLARELLRIDAVRESHDDIMDRDRRWEDATGMSEEDADFMSMEWPEDIREQIDEEDELSLRSAMQDLADMPDEERNELQRRVDDRDLTLLRLLAIESALVAFVRDHGQPPAALEALVPDDLSRLPLAPFTEKPFRYSSTDGDCLVYSPGPTGVDHGGRCGSWFEVEAGEADLCLTMNDYRCCYDDDCNDDTAQDAD